MSEPIKLEGRPTATDVSRDGRWIVATTQNPNSLTIIDANTLEVTSTVRLPDALVPLDVSVSNDGQYAYTANWDGRADQAPHLFGGGRKPTGDTVSVVALASGHGSLIRSLPVGKSPMRIAAAPNGLVYVLADSPAPGPGQRGTSIWLIDGSSATVLKSKKWGRERSVVISSYGHGDIAFSRTGLAFLPTVAKVEIVNTGTNQRESNAGVVVCRRADSIAHATGVTTSSTTGVGFAAGYSVPYGDHYDASTCVVRFGPDSSQVSMRAQFDGLRSGPCLVSPDGTQLIVAVEPAERSPDRNLGAQLLVLETESLTETAKLGIAATDRLSQTPDGSIVLGVPPADLVGARNSGEILVLNR